MDLDEVAQYEPPHQDLRCLLMHLFSSLVLAHWSMVTHRLRNERTGFVFWTHRFLRKMADIRPLSQVRNFFTFVFIAIR